MEIEGEEAAIVVTEEELVCEMRTASQNINPQGEKGQTRSFYA